MQGPLSSLKEFRLNGFTSHVHPNKETLPSYWNLVAPASDTTVTQTQDHKIVDRVSVQKKI